MSEKESNNTRATANALVSGSAIKGQLSSKTDIDYYSFAATSAGSISIDFDPTVNHDYTNYYNVSLRDSAGISPDFAALYDVSLWCEVGILVRGSVTFRT